MKNTNTNFVKKMAQNINAAQISSLGSGNATTSNAFNTSNRAQATQKNLKFNPIGSS